MVCFGYQKVVGILGFQIMGDSGRDLHFNERFLYVFPSNGTGTRSKWGGSSKNDEEGFPREVPGLVHNVKSWG